MAKRLKTLGLVGGSFDPPHWAHFQMAQGFDALLNFDEIRFIPAGQPWQKPPLKFNDTQRCALLQAGIHEVFGDTARVVLDPCELKRSGPSYTLDTLRDIRHQVGADVSLCWLMGMDQWLNLPTWHQWQDLWGLTHFCVAGRAGVTAASMPASLSDLWQARSLEPLSLTQSPCGLILHLEMTQPLSSTHIRTVLAQPQADWQSLQRHCPAAVLQLLRQWQDPDVADRH